MNDEAPPGQERSPAGPLRPEYLDCLRRHHAVCILADLVRVLPPLELVKKLDVVTGAFGYLRLMGHRHEVDALTNTFDKIVIDRTDQVRADAEAINAIRERVPMLVFVNNHYAGYAPETVRQLHEALR